MPPIEPINGTAFEVTLSGGDKVEIGDRNSIDFRPHIKLNRWDGECFLAIQPAGLSEEEVEYEVEGDKVKCKYKVKYEDDTEEEFEAEFYPLEPTTVIAKDKDGNDVEFTQNDLGGFEFEIVLKKKPKTNKIVLDIETQGLKFSPQPYQRREGVICPENVKGSISAYHTTKTNMHRTKADAEKYKCGKALHIYRPKITDAVGKWVWGDLTLDEQSNTLTITINQTWLDDAIYPVNIDPNFGYEDKGASSYETWEFCGTRATAPATGTVTSISMYLKVKSGGTNCDVNFGYYENGDVVADHVAHGTKENPGNIDDWKTIAVSGAITQDAIYWIIGQQEIAGYYYEYEDSETDWKQAYDASFTFDDWGDDPDVAFYYANTRTSIYCTYEEAGPPAGQPTMKRWGGVPYMQPKGKGVW